MVSTQLSVRHNLLFDGVVATKARPPLPPPKKKKRKKKRKKERKAKSTKNCKAKEKRKEKKRRAKQTTGLRVTAFVSLHVELCIKRNRQRKDLFLSAPVNNRHGYSHGKVVFKPPRP